MRSWIFSGVALVALAGAATAADLPARVQAPLPPPVWSWSGCYMGVNAGYGWGRNHVTDATETSAAGTVFRFADFDFNSNGALAGGQFGCNWQASAVVFGVETDIQWANVKGSVLFPNAIFNFPSAIFNTEVSSELRYFGTVRGRIGYAFTPAAMLYVTGGFAYGEVQTSLSFPFAAGVVAPIANTFIDYSRRTHYGYAVGGGWEALVTPRLSVKAEYLYVDLGAGTQQFVIAGDTYSWSERLKMHTFKLGLNFLWPSAAVATY
jgi:outer membrane immunogenic protein